MKTFLFLVQFILPPFLKKVFLSIFTNAHFGKHSHISWFSAVMGNSISMGPHTSIKPFTLIKCSGDVKLEAYTEISSFTLVYGCSSFLTGKKCYIGPQCWINTSEEVRFGDYSAIGPRSMLFTHGSFLPYTQGYPVKFGKITIGNNVWITAGVFIHPGVTIEDNVIVNSKSVIKKSISSNKLVEGFPADEIRSLDSICKTIDPTKRAVLIKNMQDHFIQFLKQTIGNVNSKQISENIVTLKFQRRNYCIIIINSINFDFETLPKINKNIALVNCDESISQLNSFTIPHFNFGTLTTLYSHDPLHKALYDFFKRYYGITFTYKD